ncbi:MAG TPA: rRNA maturation RNase YbeY [Candidatus Angelobacter sp.]|nr:rRNA maturation RNase YbeY [Candidatus Angelobacter sp.]
MIILDRKDGKADVVNPVALQRFARRAQTMARVKGEVAVLITSRSKVQALNRRFRKKDKATDVLSFPSHGGGDIAICFEIARQNATWLGHSVTDEIKILVLHGMLHLAGYDHETDSGQMARAEARLRARLELPASLIQRSRDGAAVTSPSGRGSPVVRKKTLRSPGRKTP